MEVSGVVSRQLRGFFRRDITQAIEVSGADARRAPSSLSFAGVGSGTRDVGLVGRRDSTAVFTPGNMNSMFSDDGHLQYYVGPRCHGKSKEKEKVKRKLKLLKGLAGDLSASSRMVFHSDVGEFQGKLMSVEETREALGRQLQQLKAEEKELKRKKKLEKAMLKAARVQTMHDSSSSSSESSDNEVNVIDRSYRIRKALSQPFPDEQQTNAVQGITLPPPLQTQQHAAFDVKNGSSSSSRLGSGGRVEVCMGNKCRKAGAAALMEEFERVMGVDGAVCGCKCMGKCRDGPNVRVSGSLDTDTLSANPLCIGVGVEDVDSLVEKFLGQGQRHSRLAPAT